MSKLLIEDVLRNRVKVISDGEWTLLGTPDEVIKELEAVMLAHGEMVIGIDELEASPDGSKQYQGRMSRNALRRKQRERNK